MKLKKLPILLSLLVGCMLAVSACSAGIHFHFDEDSTVQLTYSCEDAEKNFETQLNGERSGKFLRSLNKISYRKVTEKDIDLAPAYDSLVIETDGDTLYLPDLLYAIQYGGYFHLNGALCRTEEKFGFLAEHLAEFCPDIVPTDIPFKVQYVKQTVGAGENDQIIKSVQQLNDYIAAETQRINAEINFPEFQLFKEEAVAKYNDKFFETSFLVIFMKEASSGSYGFKVNDVGISGDRLIVDYRIIVPTGDVDVTADMAYWYSFVELGNEYRAIERVDFVTDRYQR